MCSYPVSLVMQLFGPMQSWGSSSQWSERDTGGEPSKSGVVGILAAAQGRSRDEPVDDLAALRLGVRVDLPGVPAVDFQTAGGGRTSLGIVKAQDSEPTLKNEWAWLDGSPRPPRKGSSISNRHHLQDAAFLVVLEGDNPELIEALDAALRSPVYPLALGRRGYVPAMPIAMPPGRGVVESPMGSVMIETQWLPWQEHIQMDTGNRRSAPPVLTVSEVPGINADAIRQDQPIGAAFATRQFGPRGVKHKWVTVKVPDKEEDSDDHS